MERAEAAGAHEHARAVDRGVLEIGILAGPVHRIVVAAEELPLALHLGTLAAFLALSHGSSGVI